MTNHWLRGAGKPPDHRGSGNAELRGDADVTGAANKLSEPMVVGALTAFSLFHRQASLPPSPPSQPSRHTPRHRCTPGIAGL